MNTAQVLREKHVSIVVDVDDRGRPKGERVFACSMCDGTEFLFKFFDDELSFTKDELIGKTQEEVWELKREKDVIYLQTP